MSSTLFLHTYTLIMVALYTITSYSLALIMRNLAQLKSIKKNYRKDIFSGSLLQLCHHSALLQCPPYPFTIKHELRIFICRTFQIQNCSIYVNFHLLSRCQPWPPLCQGQPQLSICQISQINPPVPLTDTSIFA